MASLAGRVWGIWLLLHSAVEAANQVPDAQHHSEGFVEYRAYEDWSETEIIILLGLALTCVLVFLVVGLALNRRSRQHRQRTRRKTITAAEIEDHFPILNIDDEPTCAVCLSTIEVDEPCRRTQCGHDFHADCIMQWWTHKPRRALRCPICRKRQHIKRGTAEPDQDAQKGQQRQQEQESEEPQELLELEVQLEESHEQQVEQLDHLQDLQEQAGAAAGRAEGPPASDGAPPEPDALAKRPDVPPEEVCVAVTRVAIEIVAAEADEPQRVYI